MNELLRFRPLYQDRVWGGRALETSLGRSLPPDRPIGESWDLVDRPEAQSVVREGPFEGQTLRSLLLAKAEEIMGPDYSAEKPFPILVKWLDCRERLSLQVHPPAEIAPALGGEPKTENWYIAAAAPGSGLMVGLKRGVTRADFCKLLVEMNLEDCVHRFPVSAGDSILVRSGTLHAIDAGNLILEIQQNSDTTYRVYDWGRMGLDGRPRQMHVAESIASINWGDFEPAPVRAAPVEAVIADAPEFCIRRVPMAVGGKLVLEAGEQPRLLNGVEGTVEIRTATGMVTVGRGETVLLPFSGRFEVSARSPSVVLLTEDFV